MREYNNTYHRTIKTKPVDVKDNTYIDSMELHSNDKDPKFKVGDHVRISKNTVPWTYIINDLNGEEMIGSFYEQELQKNKNLG